MATYATAAAAAATKKSPKDKQQESEQIVNTFQKMREDQRLIASKAAELQMDLKSHELVIETLKDVDKDRKCFRMIGGILVERTVREVLPALEQNKESISKLIESLQNQIVSKGKEINDYREKYNIRFQGEIEQQKQESETAESKKPNEKSTGILVEQH